MRREARFYGWTSPAESRPIPWSKNLPLAGFDLHANVAVPAADRTRLEQLCRYLLRPAVAQDRLRLLADGRIVLTLKTAWADGTRHLVFEPLELLEKLAAFALRNCDWRILRTTFSSRVASSDQSRRSDRP